MSIELLGAVAILFYLAATAVYAAYLFLQKDALHSMGVGLLTTAFAVHTLLVAGAFWRMGSIPVHNLHQTLSMAGWILTGFYLGFHFKFRLRLLGIFVAPLSTVLMVAAARLPLEPERINPAFKSFWVVCHVVLILMGDAAFTMACGAGVLYLLQEHAIKTKKRGFFYRRLPSLELLDNVGYTCIISGFCLLTIGLIGGFLYAKTLWGHFWSWDPKEVWSAAAWLFYAALLHERLTMGWRGRRSAIMAIIGFGVLAFTFLGVNFLMPGHHQPFTQD